ncbi:bifunctional 2',3'-cyclic-nucleotide 2'-phosphodiesterase/3'-nucleotidase [Natroniella sulfidigena]|uniref:bifunctional 2',3'-cyclic-nucleotide 2'-phosphodiesterase/3'-nucleotidase n=1 Tax=Natroniella sulfidigena TaxID=723921 RepID=UPI00200BA014|nr:bifunctional 2',3'-cyclic-nucleotide 2'-phosphodiesterase/3'-nucleotidase [Natroniella sulfidigena]MCK8817831.1 bifunctional 2',3'-cyclic-nucleotide 2'-phosphodiesterase/3'-nucleotidase [Natroniella sulfidigena]
MSKKDKKKGEKRLSRRDFLVGTGQVLAGTFITGLGFNLSSNTANAMSSGPVKSEHQLTLLTTTDEHQYILPYDYMADAPNETIGLSKVFTLIEEERKEQDNTMLLSAGDTIQGSLIGNYEYQVEPLEEGETQTIVEVLNHMGYEAITMGNHELQDYGMDFFELARDGSDFPWLAANIKLADNPDEFYVEPYTIIEQEVDGEVLKVGIIGFLPPQTMLWGRDHVEGKLEIKDIVEQAEKYVPEVKEKSDIVIALAHTGIEDAPKDSDDAREDAALYLAQVDGIDAMILGHDHNYMPGDYDGIEKLDNELGIIHGVPTIMAGSWGGALGAIDLDLVNNNGDWEVKDAKVRLRKIDESVASHPEIEEMAQDVHQKTIEYVRTPIGATEIGITSYFSRVADSPVTQIVNDAQIWWAERTFANGEYSNLPILSAAAPFQAGRQDAEYFTEVFAGNVTIGDVTDIYIYDNQIRVMKLNGEEVIEWLEKSAENFNQIDPNFTATQELLNGEFSAFNYDVIDGIEYEIDVTQPVGERIVNVTYEGSPLTTDQEFLVVTNDYRAGGGGGHVPQVDPVYAPAGEVNREMIVQYIEENEPISPEPTNNWRIKPVETAGTVTFRSHPEAEKEIVDSLKGKVEQLEIDENGMGVYKIDLANL